MEEQRLGRILWRGKWLMLISLAVAVALALFATKRAEKVYEATAILRVNATPPTGTNVSPSDLSVAAQALAQTDATLIVDRSFLASIANKVRAIDGHRLSTGELQSALGAKAITGTNLVKLTADSSSPDNAKNLASDVANAFVISNSQSATQSTARTLDALRARIATLTKQIQAAERAGSTEQVAALTQARNSAIQQQESLFSQGAQQGSSIDIPSQPSASSVPVRPRPVLNLAAGVLLGLLVGFGLAYLRTRLDRGLHSTDEAEELLNVPILASIPVRRRYSSDDPVLGEAYDVLRANLAFLSLDNPIQVITFSSYNPREGKSSTVEGLAYAAVRGGMSVVMVDGDVRTRTLSVRLGQDEAPGLTNVIVGMAMPEDAIVELAPGLALLPAGPTPPNPPSLLSSNRMRELIAQLREQYSLVIIDSPPVASLADASILAAVSDGVAVVARVGVTERADLPSAAANLRHSPTPIVGVVLLEPRTIDQTYYPSMTKGGPVVQDTAVRS